MIEGGNREKTPSYFDIHRWAWGRGKLERDFKFELILKDVQSIL